MTSWRRCRSALNEGQFEYINLDNVAKVVVHPQGSLIIFVGVPDTTTLVKETPEEIIGVVL